MGFKRKKKSSNMKKRISKLEEQIEPIIKTFEQRQYDYTTPAGGVALSYVTSQMFHMGSLCPTLQNNTTGQPAISEGTVRLGDKITLMSIDIRGELRATIASEVDSRVRLLLVRFPEWNNQGAATATAQVLQQYPTTTGGPTDPVVAQFSQYKNVVSTINTADLTKYQVLYDKQFQMQDVNSASTNNQNCWRFKFNIKKRFKRGLVCQYSKALTDTPEINNIVLIALSDSSVTPHPQICFSSRFKYMDA